MSMMFISWFWLIPKSCSSIWSNVPLRCALYTSGWSGNAPKPAHKQTQLNTDLESQTLKFGKEDSQSKALTMNCGLLLPLFFGQSFRWKAPPTSRPVDGHCCPSCSCRCEFAKTCNWRQHKDMHLSCASQRTLRKSASKPGELESSTKNKTEIQKKKKTQKRWTQS